MSDDDIFADSSAFSGSLNPPQPVLPPTPLLGAAAVLSAFSAVFLFGSPYNDFAHLMGWLLASVGSVGMLAAFTGEDLKRRQDPHYSPRPSRASARSALGVLALVLCALHAWPLAWSLASR